jgi:tetratricopeptide (TPR) repeat protein
LGATLICLLTGTRSLDVGNLIDDNYRFDFKGKVPQLSPRFVQWLTKVVEPNLKNRYANAAVALEALKPIQVVGASQSRKTALVVGLASLSIILLGKTWIFSKSETAVNSSENTNPSFVTPTPNLRKASSPSNKPVPFHISSQSTDAALYESADLVRRSRKLADQEGFSQALPLVEKALELYPDDSEAWATRCWILGNLERYREALESCNRALQLNPDSAWSWGRRGQILVALGQSQEALIALDKSLKIAPDDDWYLTWRGLALNKLERYQEALTSFEKALAINPAPNYSWGWYGKGIALEELGRKKEALASYEEAIKRSPRWQQAINKRNQLQSQMTSFK